MQRSAYAVDRHDRDHAQRGCFLIRYLCGSRQEMPSRRATFSGGQKLLPIAPVRVDQFFAIPADLRLAEQRCEMAGYLHRHRCDFISHIDG